MFTGKLFFQHLQANAIEQLIKGNFDNNGPFCMVDPEEKLYNLQVDLGLKSTYEQILCDIRNAPDDFESLCVALQVSVGLLISFPSCVRPLTG